MSHHIKVERLACSACGFPWRRSDQYVCSTCAKRASMFNHTRPSAMQGAAQSIFAPYPTKVRGS